MIQDAMIDEIQELKLSGFTVQEAYDELKRRHTKVPTLKTVRKYYNMEAAPADNHAKVRKQMAFDAEPFRSAVIRIPSTVFCIHGNHEMRPQSLPSLYRERQWRGGTVFAEDAYPNILFAKDGEVYDLDGLKAIVIGGAYSVDKWYRLERGEKWFSDEQPSEEVKALVETKLATLDWKVDIVLSHTCPFGSEPTEAFLPGVDQSMVDTSTEVWLDRIERQLDYGKWYCGHWHIEKTIGGMHFMFNEFEALKSQPEQM